MKINGEIGGKAMFFVVVMIMSSLLFVMGPAFCTGSLVMA